jgi:hypothetical protein
MDRRSYEITGFLAHAERVPVAGNAWCVEESGAEARPGEMVAAETKKVVCCKRKADRNRNDRLAERETFIRSSQTGYRKKSKSIRVLSPT